MKTSLILIGALCLGLPACAQGTIEDLPRPTAPADGGAAGADAGPPAPKPQVTPGAFGVPSASFGGFNYDAYRGDHLEATKPVDLYLYEGAPKDATVHWHPDFAALEMLAHFHVQAATWCALDTAMLNVAGTDCCTTAVPYSSTTAFDYWGKPDAGYDADAGPIVNCGQAPDSWRVGTSLASVGLRGLSTVRPLSAPELRRELANGRPVLARNGSGGAGTGALVIIAGWSPIDSGGDRFLLVREGSGFHWSAYVDIIEHRDQWLANWTNSWFKISATVNGCNTGFDPSCG